LHDVTRRQAVSFMVGDHRSIGQIPIRPINQIRIHARGEA
jgi:hypothetical protein